MKRLAVALALTLAACGIPRDPEGTLERVDGGVMRVGVTEAPPWVELGAEEPDGIEVRLVESLAEELDAEIEWVDGSEQELFGALTGRDLDLVVGGLTAETPWSAEAAVTHPYLTTATLVAVPVDMDMPEDIAGLEVGLKRIRRSQGNSGRRTRSSSRLTTSRAMTARWRSIISSPTTST
jgi:polar amino acid transport system substrate-binding protein